METCNAFKTKPRRLDPAKMPSSKCKRPKFYMIYIISISCCFQQVWRPFFNSFFHFCRIPSWFQVGPREFKMIQIHKDLTRKAWHPLERTLYKKKTRRKLIRKNFFETLIFLLTICSLIVTKVIFEMLMWIWW